ncbi:MAG: dihydropteroate synthase [Microthrixaceae bacterium]|nr:dihydropteroate synthase [Microthrixaceae bacterium]
MSAPEPTAEPAGEPTTEPSGATRRTLIMGVVNVTPDSFSDGGQFAQADAAIAQGLRLAAQGADWIDIGGESTRPGAVRVDPAVERARVLPVVRELAAAGVAVSIDTLNASTASAAVAAGARLVNDVSGGLADPAMLAAVAETGADVALGHWRGPSSDMYAHAHYDDLVAEVRQELHRRVDAALAAGVDTARIVLDPGIGFAKGGAQNWQALAALPRFVAGEHRVLIGTSRKRFLRTLLGEARDDLASRDLATAMTSGLAAAAGVWCVRVHDVATTRIALDVAAAWQSGVGTSSGAKENDGNA